MFKVFRWWFFFIARIYSLQDFVTMHIIYALHTMSSTVRARYNYIWCNHNKKGLTASVCLKVIGSPEEKSRLILCRATVFSLRRALFVLGITPLHKLWDPFSPRWLDCLHAPSFAAAAALSDVPVFFLHKSWIGRWISQDDSKICLQSGFCATNMGVFL